MRIAVLCLALAGCIHVDGHPSKNPEAEGGSVIDWQALQSPPPETQKPQEQLEPTAGSRYCWADPVSGRLCRAVDCTEQAKEVADAEERLKRAHEAGDAWRKRCEPVLRYQHHRLEPRPPAPQLVHLCDGHITDAQETTEEQQAAVHLGVVRNVYEKACGG